jgi:transcription initiation factor IIF auxiliary subunit
MGLDRMMEEMTNEVEEAERIGDRFGTLELSHTSKQLPVKQGDGRTWYEVEVSLAGPPHVLADVRRVEYILHPTFKPDRVAREGPSNLKIRVWGAFTIRAEVTFKSRGPSVTLARYLTLH